jgi:hypothetical protein
MIIVNGILLHSITTVLTFGSNSNSLSPKTLQRFVNGYSIMEKTQMVGFFLQELILSAIYIREAVRLLKLSETVHDDARSFQEDSGHGHLKNSRVRKTIYQLLAINVIIIIMDLALLAVEFANLYLIETTLKGVVYSIKLKLEFAVLGKLVQFVRNRAASSGSSDPRQHSHTLEGRGTSSGATIEKIETNRTNRTNNSAARTNASLFGNTAQSGTNTHHFPEFVDPERVNTDVTHAQPAAGEDNTEHGWETRAQEGSENWRRRSKLNRGSWIDEEMDKNNIG